MDWRRQPQSLEGAHEDLLHQVLRVRRVPDSSEDQLVYPQQVVTVHRLPITVGASRHHGEGAVRRRTVGSCNKAVQQGLNKRQIDENQVFNLAAIRPDLLTGVDPATGNPAPYGAVGVDIDCAVIGFTDKAPTANLADPIPNSQFPPR